MMLCKKVKMIASISFKKGSAKYRIFHTQHLTLQKDADLCITAKVIIQLANKYFAELTLYGLSAGILDDITTLNNEFQDLIISQQLAECDKKGNNLNRILFGNEIYTEMMRYTAVGMAIWETKSEARYNDYVVYNVKSKQKK